ncbi:MAG: hypothetical protein ACPGJH_04530 [Alphaproteobacteria bacterium]
MTTSTKPEDTANIYRRIDKIFGNGQAFVALKSDGTLVSWGNELFSAIEQNQDIRNEDFVAIHSNEYAFVGRRSDGTLIAWGDERYGGKLPAEYEYSANPIKGVVANEKAFAAWRQDGSVMVWGDKLYGGSLDASSYQDIAQSLETGVIKIFANNSAFAALKDDGRVITWGPAHSGGLQNGVWEAENTIDITATRHAFAALQESGRVITWGRASAADDDGGYSLDIEGIQDDVIRVYATQGAFAALKKDGSVVVWGDPMQGGQADQLGDFLSQDVIEIVASTEAFCARKSDGTTQSWGTLGNSDASSFTVQNPPLSVTKVIANDLAFCAVKEDGTVSAWGMADQGGVAPDVPELQSRFILEVVATREAFAARNADGQVIIWGSFWHEGSQTQGHLILDLGATALYAHANAFVIERGDGSLHAIGDAHVGGDVSEVDFSMFDPYFYATPPQAAYENILYFHELSVGDKDYNDMATVSLIEGPDWLQHNEIFGSLYGTPNQNHVTWTGIEPEWVILEAIDLDGYKTIHEFPISVAPFVVTSIQYKGLEDGEYIGLATIQYLCSAPQSPSWHNKEISTDEQGKINLTGLTEVSSFQLGAQKTANNAPLSLKGSVSITDVIETLKIAIGISSPDPLAVFAADTDENGDITITDVMNVLKIAVGINPVDQLTVVQATAEGFTKDIQIPLIEGFELELFGIVMGDVDQSWSSDLL